jgi:hypothetical protein
MSLKKKSVKKKSTPKAVKSASKKAFPAKAKNKQSAKRPVRHSNVPSDYLQSAFKVFMSYKTLGEKAIGQVSEEKLFWQFNEESNSIATIVKHLWGNMLSRWTDFLSTDGEKRWRNRDTEFENNFKTRAELFSIWQEGWERMFDTIEELNDEDLEKTVYIRGEAHTVIEAINRQIAHYSYHIGQIVFLAKMVSKEQWKSLSIPKGKSKEFNEKLYSKLKN